MRGLRWKDMVGAGMAAAVLVLLWVGIIWAISAVWP